MIAAFIVIGLAVLGLVGVYETSHLKVRIPVGKKADFKQLDTKDAVKQWVQAHPEHLNNTWLKMVTFEFVYQHYHTEYVHVEKYRVTDLRAFLQQVDLDLAAMRDNRSFVAALAGSDGWDFEKRFAEALRQMGHYQQVMVTPGSGDFGLDVIAVTKNGVKHGFQLKRYQQNVGVHAVEEAVAGGVYYHCPQVYVVTTAGMTAAAAQMAEATGCRVILGDQMLARMRQLGQNE